MRKVRLLLAWCFLVAALLSVAAAILFLFADTPIVPMGTPGAHLKIILVGASLILTALFGASGWAVLREKADAGKWAMTASLALVALGFLILYGRPMHGLNPAWLPIVFGIGGVAAFARRRPQVQKAPHGRPISSIPGDGTNQLVNKLILVAGAVGGIGGVWLFAVWALAHGLPRAYPPFYALQVLLAILLVLGLHEAGHAVAGFFVQMKLIGIVVGPFQWFKTHGKSRFVFRGAGLVAFGGQTMVAPATMKNFRDRKALQVAAGPAASLLGGALAAAALFTAHGHPWAQEWSVLAVFADITTLVGVLNLVPFGNKSMYSDGAKLYQLLHGGLWTRYHCALGMFSSISVTTQRPRDYDIATIEEAAGNIARGRDEAFLRLCAYAYYLDRGQLDEAAKSIWRSESLVGEWHIDPPNEWCTAFVFADSVLRHDAAPARQWWNLMESRKTFHFADNHWTARSALFLAEKRLDEAADALANAEAWASQLPNTGSAEFERGLVVLLRKAFNDASAIPPVQTLPVPAN